ncbi:uncharacterized protein MISP3 [Hyperolius riggenbachi]|uniref:uncharacterized protein MISP3 n=1 Tax=Hyperolius riggenbachi TaxID=752182 RepID=UPI0035A2D410
MASEQTSNSVTENNYFSGAADTSQQIGNPASISAVPQPEHSGAPDNHAAASVHVTEGQHKEESVQNGTAEEKQRGEQSTEEENDRTSREFSETIKKLDSVLLEAGKTEGQIEGEETDGKPDIPPGVTAATEHTTESEGETTTQVPAEETTAQVLAEETTAQVPAEETTAQVPAEETTTQVPAEETTVPVEKTTVQVPTEQSIVQVPTEETTVQVPTEETTLQVPKQETTVQVPKQETTVQVPAEETTVQVPTEETAESEESIVQVSGGGNTVQVPEEGTTVQVTEQKATVQVSVGEADVQGSAEEGSLQVLEPTHEPSELVTLECSVSPQAAEGPDTGIGEKIPAQVISESWIDTLVRNIVIEATSSEALIKEPVDSSCQLTEESVHSYVQVTQEDTGAAHIAVQGSEQQREVEVIGFPGQVIPGEAGGEQVAGAPAEPVTKEEVAAEVEAGGQVQASGEEVTPDLVTVPREGTLDSAACREKEWLPLICTSSEVRADTAEETVTQQGTVPEADVCDTAADMKDREMLEEGDTLAPETPIEREIRLSMEREMTLRQQRGINVPIGEPELVEVRRMAVSIDPVALPGKERQLAGAQMQRDILLESRREQDLVEQGKVMATYDRGPQQELQERKLMFESMNTEPSDPPFKRRQSELKSVSIEIPFVVSSIQSNHRAPVTPSAEVRKGPSYAEANGSNIIILEHGSLIRRSTAGNAFSAAPTDARRPSPAEARRSTPADLRFSRSNSGSSPLPNTETPIPAPGSPFQVLRSPSPRSILEREIEEVQEREQELRRQRRSIYGKDDNDGQIQAENRDGVQSGNYQPERPAWRRLTVNWPPNRGNAMNGQAPESPRFRKQHNALLQSWESGNPNPQDKE